jgi:excisionase family DNA binding protein
MVTEIQQVAQSLLTIEQVAHRLALKESTIRDWLRRGILPGVKISSKEWRIDPVDLEEFERKRRTGKRNTE